MNLNNFASRFDAHMHGPISFHDYSLKIQGYAKNNVLQLLVDACEKRRINLCAITSNNMSIVPGSLHDRFGYLLNKYALKLPPSYISERLGKNSFFVMKKTMLLASLMANQLWLKNMEEELIIL